MEEVLLESRQLCGLQFLKEGQLVLVGTLTQLSADLNQLVEVLPACQANGSVLAGTGMYQ